MADLLREHLARVLHLMSTQAATAASRIVSISPGSTGCCHHEAGLPSDDESMRSWTAQLERADALLFGRVTYEDGVSVAEAGYGHVARLDG